MTVLHIKCNLTAEEQENLKYITQDNRTAHHNCRRMKDLFLVSAFYIRHMNWLLDDADYTLERFARSAYGIFEDKDVKRKNLN